MIRERDETMTPKDYRILFESKLKLREDGLAEWVIEIEDVERLIGLMLAEARDHALEEAAQKCETDSNNFSIQIGKISEASDTMLFCAKEIRALKNNLK